MIEWWQHFPETLNPVALTIGFFSVRWYALFFLTGFLFSLFLALRFGKIFGNALSKEKTYDLFLTLFFGALIGGHIGYFVLYAPEVFFEKPSVIFSPYDFGSGVWTGIAGMSYHGGLVGGIVALIWFSRREKVPFWRIADFLVLFAPVATLFGRLGNFFNLELYGRVTEKSWGMLFPGVLPVGVLRHPSQLYEAFLEGICLFIILLFWRRFARFEGYLACVYLMLYAVVRFIGEYFREPEHWWSFSFSLSGQMTFGQAFSVIVFLIAVSVFAWLGRAYRGTIGPRT